MALGSQDARLAGDPGVQDNKLSLNQVLSVKPPTCPPTPKRMVLGVVSKCQNLSCLKVFRIIVKSKKCFTDTKLFRRSEGMQVKVVGNPYTSCKCKLLLFNAFIVTLPAPTPPTPLGSGKASIGSSHLHTACRAGHATPSVFPPLSSQAPPSPQIPRPRGAVGTHAH